jgi:hypothetical protein
VGLTLVLTFVAFTPWTPPRGHLELLAAIDNMSLVNHVVPPLCYPPADPGCIKAAGAAIAHNLDCIDLRHAFCQDATNEMRICLSGFPGRCGRCC